MALNKVSLISAGVSVVATALTISFILYDRFNTPFKAIYAIEESHRDRLVRIETAIESEIRLRKEADESIRIRYDRLDSRIDDVRQRLSGLEYAIGRTRGVLNEKTKAR